MLLTLFSIVSFCYVAASATNRRLLQQELTVGNVQQDCHCATFGKVASEFCTDEILQSETWEETCFQVQDFINVGLGLIHETSACHVDLCGNKDLQFFQELCADLQSGSTESACTLVLQTQESFEGRRTLRRNCHCGCFDQNSQVVLKSGSTIAIKNIVAGSQIQTCESGVFTPVLAMVDHQQDDVPMKKLHFENGLSLLLTNSHMVYIKDELVPAYAIQPGMVVDGQTVQAISNVTGHPANVVTLRQDIMVNGLCSTWLTEEFMPTTRFKFLWDMINPVAALFPSVVFAGTQALADNFVPLYDEQTIGTNTILVIMFSTGFFLVFISAAMVMSFYAALHNLLGLWSHKI